ncbi:hypothetical protein JOM56_006163 [Amanita muscaria]
MSSSHNPTTVVTTPPWAKDEPPTPRTSLSGHADRPSNDRRLSDNTNDSEDTLSRWLSFARPHTPNAVPSSHGQHASSSKSSNPRTMSWLASPSTLKDIAAFSRRDKRSTLGDKEAQNVQTSSEAGPPNSAGLTSSLESPWIPHARGLGSQHNLSEENAYEPGHLEDAVREIQGKGFRNFALINPYAPLLFRFINMSLTSSALGIAVHIRRTELANNTLGALGSSCSVVIIFAPLTLVHVLVAIYLEYFGRPVGLWATSAKLAYTLFETFFICAWSAALSLCFDNYFTSLIPCAPASSISWFSQIPRPSIQLSALSTDDSLCNDQVALICLVGFSLLTYCINLIISLFRIFEKVKYHSNLSLK